MIVSQSGELLLWSFRRGLEHVDTTMPQDENEDRRSPRRKHILNRPLSTSDLNSFTVMFHPKDKNVFFLATYDDRDLNPAEIRVCEFRNKRCCQIFTFGLPTQSPRPVGLLAEMTDAHGTYQLLLQGPQIDKGVQLSGVTFNTISKSFRTFGFQIPLNTDYGACFIWNDQMALTYELEVPPIRPWPLLVVGSSPSSGSLEAAASTAAGDHPVEVAMECMVKSATSQETVDSNAVRSKRLQTMIEALEQRKERHDIIRAPGTPDSLPDLYTVTGLRYLLLFFGGLCNWEGDHVRGCPRVSGLLNSLEPLWTIVGDDGFLVIVNQTHYTVFAVDEDGKVAEAIRDRNTLREEELRNESDQHAGPERLER
ncbi:MAG: hypothetical protein Q8869_00160 [Candidatus Phytoplasma australasiaticum]|nr:hypothetical protein [Candidatus Phytoplasma australasiaticum]